MVKILQNIFVNVVKLTNLFKVVFVSLFVLNSIGTVLAANINLSPSSGTYSIGKTFSVDVTLNNNQDNINAVSGSIEFPNDLLSVSSISKTGSLLSMWAQEPTYSNVDGTISFEGISLNSGFTASSGKVLTIIFKAKDSGDALVSLKSGSVLSNDGNATDVLGTLGKATFSITGSKQVVVEEVDETPIIVNTSVKTSNQSTLVAITSSTYPDSTKWYSSLDASFEWTLPGGATAVRTLYDDREKATPSKVYDPPITNRSFKVETDGVIYMHVQAKTNSGWGETAHYKFQIDAEAPEVLKISLPEGAITKDPTPSIQIIAEDKISGIDHITMNVDDNNPVSYQVEKSQLYNLPRQIPGNHTVTVGAIDKAGNVSTATLSYTISPIEIPIVNEYTKNLTAGDYVKISGKTYPKAIIEAVVTRRSSSGVFSSLFTNAGAGENYKEIETVTANNSGIFNLTWSKNLDAGVYLIKVRAIDDKGAVSEYTDEQVIVIEDIALIRFGVFIMNWLSLILIIIVSGISVAGTLWYSFVQFSSFRRKVRRTMIEAENTLKTNVAALRRDIEEFRTALLKAEKKRKLTKEEQAILKKLTKRLEITEKEIEKKLEAIV